IWGVAPAYVMERFPTATRGIGPGLSYHVGAVAGSIMPVLIGAMQDRGAALPQVMTIAIAASLILSVVLIWLGPETRGRNFNDSIASSRREPAGCGTVSTKHLSNHLNWPGLGSARKHLRIQLHGCCGFNEENRR